MPLLVNAALVLVEHFVQKVCNLNLIYCNYNEPIIVTFIAVTGIRGGSPLVLIMSGAIGGVLILIIILVLIVMLFIRIRHKLRQPNVDASLSELKCYLLR